MAKIPYEPTEYRVAYSEHVRSRLRQLANEAKSRGVGKVFLDALKRLDELLHLYPQFGEPLSDLKREPLKLWIGTVYPLVAQYLVDDEQRVVILVRPIRMLSRSENET
jgi:hypothetical protein